MICPKCKGTKMIKDEDGFTCLFCGYIKYIEEPLYYPKQQYTKGPKTKGEA